MSAPSRPLAAPPRRDRSRRDPRPRAMSPAVVAMVAVVGVVVFWWVTTGVLVATQRGPVVRVATLGVAVALAGLGAMLVARNRAVLTPRGATASFFGGALLWLFVATALYGGWVVGLAPAMPGAGAPPGGAAATMDAVGAMLYNDLLGLAAVGLAWWLSRGGANRTGLHVIAFFWVAHEAAKVNLFLGVAHPGTEFLPPYLTHLARHFGPAVNSPALPVTVAAFTGYAGWLAWRAWRDPRPWARRAAWLLAVLAALAALEHLLLGVGAGTVLWRLFLDARGT